MRTLAERYGAALVKALAKRNIMRRAVKTMKRRRAIKDELALA